MPSSRMVADEPIIPANLEHQVGTTGETVVPETDALMMEKEKSTEPPPIKTRTVETQRGNCNNRHKVPGSVGKARGGRLKSSQIHVRDYTTKASLGTSRDPRPG